MTDDGQQRSSYNREAQKRLVWGRSASRCAICQKPLDEGELTHVEMTLGELAHIVGRSTAAGSPRGNFDLAEEDRDRAENMMLICASAHDEVDREGATDVLTVEKLREMKRRHEDWVYHVTGLARERQTVVLRLLGDVRGRNVDLSRELASEAVIQSDERFPDFPLAYDRHGVEIDLRGFPGEGEGTDDYWRQGVARINEVIGHALRPAVRDGRIKHLSVFAFGRLPLLIHLGAQLDDTFAVAMYQRHRSTERWEWPSDEDLEFAVGLPDVTDGATEAVLITNVSGTIQPNEIPTELQTLPVFELIVQGPAEPDTLQSIAALGSFDKAVRALFAGIEAKHKNIRRLHTLAALPVAAGVVLGRAHDPHVHPSLAVYHRTNDEYRLALELT